MPLTVTTGCVVSTTNWSGADLPEAQGHGQHIFLLLSVFILLVFLCCFTSGCVYACVCVCVSVSVCGCQKHKAMVLSVSLSFSHLNFLLSLSLLFYKWCVCVCVCVCAYIHVCVCMHTCMCVCAHMRYLFYFHSPPPPPRFCCVVACCCSCVCVLFVILSPVCYSKSCSVLFDYLHDHMVAEKEGHFHLLIHQIDPCTMCWV